MNVKILVACHKPGVQVHNGVFLPIHVGKIRSNIDLGIVGDDSGDNISAKNNIYCEMTAVYWAWKNLDADYIGLCHYRRLFTFERRSFLKRMKDAFVYWEKRIVDNVFSPGSSFNYLKREYLYIKDEEEWKQRADVFEKKLVHLLDAGVYSYVVPYAYKLSSCSVANFFSTLGRDHIALLKNIVHEKFPEKDDVLQESLDGHLLYAANMFVMKKSIFYDYAEFVFTILGEHERKVVEMGWCKDPLSEKCYARMSGYLAELLTSTFILDLKRNKSLKALNANTMFLG